VLLFESRKQRYNKYPDPDLQKWSFCSGVKARLELKDILK